MNDVSNYYQIMSSEFKPKAHNPNIKKHGITLPFRAVIVGASGACKTNLLLNIIHKMSNTFEKIIICCKCRDEPLYNFLAKRIPKHVEFFEITNDTSVPSLNGFTGGQTLVCFDDLVLCDKKVQNDIAEYYIRGRKLGISSVYLTQSWFKCPKIIRIQCNYIFILKLSSMRDLRMILSEFSIIDAKSEKEALALLKDYYQYSTLDKTSFLMIDIDKSQFRKNFLEILT